MITDDWFTKIQEVCNNLVITSIGGTTESNVLMKSYSSVSFIIF